MTAATFHPGLRATLLACLFFAGFGCLIPFLPLWLEQVHGFSGSQIGLVLAIGGFSRVVAGPLAAAWADGRSDRRAPMFLFAGLLTLGFAVLWFLTGFAAVFVLVLLLDVAFWGFAPVVEAALLRLTKRDWPSYGTARGLASAAFVVGSSAVGALIDRNGPWAVWAWLFGVSALMIVSSAWMVREPMAEQREMPFRERLAAGLGMLRDRRFVLLIAAAGLIQATHSYFYVAGTLIWTGEQQLSSGLAGNLWSIGVIAEVGFLIFLARWSERFAPETLVVAGGVAAVVRWTALAALPPVWLLVPLQLLHAGTFALTFLGALRLTEAMHGEERTPTAQMIYMGLASAPAQAAATLLSGALFEWLRPQGLAGLGYLSMTAIAAVGLVLAILLWRTRDGADRAAPPADVSSIQI